MNSRAVFRIFHDQTRNSLKKSSAISHLALRILLLTLVSSLFSGMIYSAAYAEPEFRGPTYKGVLGGGYRQTPFSFIVATDSHFGSAQGNKNSSIALKSIAQYFNIASFMVHMGDITETGREEQYDAFEENIAGLPFPVLTTMGNHESRWEDPQGARFQSHFGPSTYSFDFGNWHFVVLDTTSQKETVGTLDPSILNWLDKDLASQPVEKPIAIFSHHPLVYPSSTFQDSDDGFLKILDKYNVRVVFSGHGHSFIHWRAQGRDFLMVGALMDGAYALVNVGNSSMTVVKEKAVQLQDGTVTLETEPWVTITLDPAQKVPQNPLKNLSVTPSAGTVSIGFDLSEKAHVALQIDGGYYNDLGEMNQGHTDLTWDVSKQARGIHTLRLKVTTADGPFFSSVEFEKDLRDLFLWTRDLGSSCLEDILQTSDGRLIAGTKDGNIYCLSARDGSIIWRYDAQAPWGGGALDEQRKRLYFGTAGGEFHCLDIESGDFIWKTTLDDRGFAAAPQIVDIQGGRTVCIGSSSGKMYGIDAITGQIKWVKEVGAAIPDTPAASGGLIFFGAWNARFYALDANTGKEVWSKTLGRQTYYSPVSNPIVVGQTVFTVTPSDPYSGGSYLYALRRDTGDQLFKIASSSSFMEPSQAYITSYGLTAPYILAPDYSGSISAVRTGDGVILWKLKGSSTLFGGISSRDSLMVTGGSRGVLDIFNNGTQIDIKVRDSFLLTPPAVWRARNPNGSWSYVLFQPDTRGRITAVSVPQ